KSALTLPAMRAARFGVKYEALVEKHQNLKVASQWLTNEWSGSLTVNGAERVPDDGPLLLVSNHPGMGDAISLFATLPREDVYTFVKVRTLLNVLPNFLDYCIVVDEEKPMVALRQMISKLRAGKTVLLYPRGEMEVDPAVDIYQAISSLDHWSKSIETVARAVPDLTVMPVGVGGVISKSALKSPLCSLYKKPESKNYLAATLQLMFECYRDVDVKVSYGQPLQKDAIQLKTIQSEMASLLSDVL
ncbi:MAG: 1-acyl-sn-glycerol-3-phosphate acyltransferase, partial [Chloroflexota bacterium]